jgi:thioredoxin-dependent peroxiredoxin
MAKVPHFSLPGSDGTTHTPKEFLGRTWVLYFYPKDMTSGCTAQACDFRDRGREFAKSKVPIVGISPDPIASHAKFIAKHQLDFLLLADVDHTLADKMGCWVKKSMYGRSYMGIQRSTFLIGPDGAILREWRKVKVAGHVDEVLDSIGN